MLVLPIVSFGKQTGLIMHFNIKYYKCCQLALRAIIWDVLGHYTVFLCFIYKMFYLLLLLIFLSFPDKNLWFHLIEEGKELLGMLMAALANNNGYYVLYLFLLSFSNSQLLFLKLIGISQRC